MLKIEELLNLFEEFLIERRYFHLDRESRLDLGERLFGRLDFLPSVNDQVSIHLLNLLETIKYLNFIEKVLVYFINYVSDVHLIEQYLRFGNDCFFFCLRI